MPSLSITRPSVSLLAAALAAIAACSPPGTVTGSVGGKSLAVADAYFLVGVGTSAQSVSFGLVDRTGSCELLKRNEVPKDGTGLYFTVNRIASAGTTPSPVEPGDYTIAYPPPSSGNAGFARFLVYANGSQTEVHEGHHGTVSLSALRTGAGGAASGTFDITFDGATGDAVTGTFNATQCQLQ